MAKTKASEPALLTLAPAPVPAPMPIHALLNLIRDAAIHGQPLSLVPGDTATLARHLGLVADPTRADDGKPRYSLVTHMDGPSGPEATLTDRHTMRSVTIATEQRAVLLHVLALHTRIQGAAYAPADDVAKRIWGKPTAWDSNSLHVLVHRLRKDIEKAGFEPWLLDTSRRKCIRLVGVEVTSG